MNYTVKQSLDCLPELLPPWYAANRRDLPWRGTGDPYDVWLSEIMLQQTRVAAVMEYFRRFRAELPGIAQLAACPEERLLKLWEGLGYYSRVRNLQKAARVVMESYDGHLPETAAELRKLPGIGSYTAGAIASIAFGEAVPAVDGNVLRICSRISGNDADIALPETKKALEGALGEVFRAACAHDPGASAARVDDAGDSADAEYAGDFLRVNRKPAGQERHPRVHPGILNQSMMELGATVCLPNGMPQCTRCPVAEVCYAYRCEAFDRLPVKSSRKPRRIEPRTILLIQDGDTWLIRKRPARGLLAGMWELPSAEGHLTESEALRTAEMLLSELEMQEMTVTPASGRGMLQEMTVTPVSEYGMLQETTEEQEDAVAARPESATANAAAIQPRREPIFVKKLPPAKHVFTHIEWHMTAYLIRVVPAMQAPGRHEGAGAQNEHADMQSGGTHSGARSTAQQLDLQKPHGADRAAGAVQPLVFATEEDLRERYSLPSAFSVYLQEKLS